MSFLKDLLYNELIESEVIFENRNGQVKYFEYVKKYKNGFQENSEELTEVIKKIKVLFKQIQYSIDFPESSNHKKYYKN